MFFVARSVLWKFTVFCCDLQAFAWRKTLLRILPQKQSHYCKTFDQLIFYRWRLWSPNLTSEMGFMAVFGCKKQRHKPRSNFIAKSRSMPQEPVRKYGSAAWRILWGQCLFFKSLQRAEGGGVAEPAWLWESQLRMATILGLVNTGEAILHWEDGPRGTKMQPSVWGHMPRMQGSLSESVFVHHPVTFLEVILPCCPNCTWTCIANSIVVSTKVKNLFSHIFPVSTWSPYSW